MDRCLIHPAVKFTCHSYSGPLHNSSTCYSSGAHNISFIKNTVSSSSSALLCATAFHMEFILCLWAARKERSSRTQQGLRSPGAPPQRQWWLSSRPPPPSHTPTYLPPSCPPFWHWGTRPALTLQRLANAHLGAGGETPAAAEPTPGRARTQPHMHVHSHTHTHTHTNKEYICRGTLFLGPLSPDGSSLSSQGPAANITPRQLCHSALPLLLLLLLPPPITPSAW